MEFPCGLYNSYEGLWVMHTYWGEGGAHDLGRTDGLQVTWRACLCQKAALCTHTLSCGVLCPSKAVWIGPWGLPHELNPICREPPWLLNNRRSGLPSVLVVENGVCISLQTTTLPTLAVHFLLATSLISTKLKITQRAELLSSIKLLKERQLPLRPALHPPQG